MTFCRFKMECGICKWLLFFLRESHPGSHSLIFYSCIYSLFCGSFYTVWFLSFFLCRHVHQNASHKEERVDVMLNDDDPVWVDIRHMHMREAIGKLMSAFEKFLKEHTSFRGYVYGFLYLFYFIYIILYFFIFYIRIYLFLYFFYTLRRRVLY